MEYNKLDDFLKEQLNADEMDMRVPPLGLKARRVVESRGPVKKQSPVISLFDMVLLRDFSIYKAGMATLVIAVYFFIFTLGHRVYYGGENSLQSEGLLNSANSNTLAGLTPTNVSSPVQSATVLPSIFTFATR